MRYQIIVYDPDCGADEMPEYRTITEARRAFRQYRDWPAAMIYDLERWRIVYQRGYWPTGALPIERGCNA